MAERRCLLAGSVGPERIPVRRDGDDADWFKPLHLRDEGAARERIAAQVAGGADAVVAPTWLTHRRALLPLGETRQARAWTAAAVRVARDAVEVGLERRVEALDGVSEDDVRQGRPTPLVVASLPALDEEPDEGTGRLLPREAATERDYREQAGLLADAEPDAIIVEGQGDLPAARAAVTEAAATGLPVWAAAPTRPKRMGADAEHERLARWLEVCCHAGAELVLTVGEPGSVARIAVAASVRWGGVVTIGGRAEGDGMDPAVRGWLDTGAAVIAILDGATTAVVEAAREAIDAAEREDLEASRLAQERWLRHVAEAAGIAPGGAALWLGPKPDAALPAGFEWLVMDPGEARRLPPEHYRLVVIDAADEPLDPGRLLERGGILARRTSGPVRERDELRLLTVDDGQPPLTTYRREG